MLVNRRYIDFKTPVEARTYRLAAGTYTYSVSKEGYGTVAAQFVVVNSGQIIPVVLGAIE